MTLRTAALAGIAVAVLMAACGGGQLTEEEYFAELERLGRNFAERGSSAVMNELGGETPPRGKDIIIPQLLSFLLPSLTEYVEGLRELDAPAAVQTDHNEAIDGAEKLLHTAQDIVNRPPDDPPSVAELSQLVDDLISFEASCEVGDIAWQHFGLDIGCRLGP